MTFRCCGEVEVVQRRTDIVFALWHLQVAQVQIRTLGDDRVDPLVAGVPAEHRRHPSWGTILY